MSSLDSDDLMSMSFPVKKLVEHFKHSFRERDFDEFGDILINRENNFKREIENLKRDSHTKKQVVSLLDRSGEQVDLDKFLFEELLGKERRKCQRLKETAIQLTEEKEKLADHVKTINKKLDMLFTENLKTENAKKNLVSELGKSKRKCQELEAAVTQLTEEKMMLTNDVKMAKENCDLILMENVKVENENNHLISELTKSGNKCEELEATVTLLTKEKAMLTDYVKVVEDVNQKMEKEKNNSISELNEKINELKNKNLERERLAGGYQEKCRCLDNKIAKMEHEMAQRKSESDKVVAYLNLANKVIEDLMMEKTKLDKTFELYKSKLENSSKRIKNIEENFAKMSTMKVGDKETLINDVDELGTFEMRLNLDSKGLRGRNENSSGNATVDVTLPSNGIKNNGLSNKGDGNSVQRLAKECINGAHKIKSSPGKQSGHSLKKENNEPKETLGSGVHLDGKELHSSSNKSARSSPAAARTIVDDAHKIQTSPVNKSGHNPPQEGNNEPKETLRSGAHSTKSACLSTPAARTVINIIYGGDQSKTNPNGVTHLVQTPQTSKRNRTNCEEVFLTSKRKRDQCLTDSKKNEMVKNIGKKTTYESMLQTIQTDDEFCMSAVCALYRQHLSASKYKGRPNTSMNGGFGPFESMGGCGIAEYLISGDKELRLSKSVSEVKKHDQNIIDDCRRLANVYLRKLFPLHCSAVDPLFCHL